MATSIASQDLPPLSGLMLCGVPVEALAQMTSSDFSSASYAAVDYAERRPSGTPLLVAPAAAPPDGPAAYLRGAVSAVLSARAGGASAQASSSAATDDDKRVQAELALALAEVAAEAAGGPVAAPAAATPPPPPPGLGATFAAAQRPVPSWLTAAVSESQARTSITAPPPAPPSPAGDPVQYANSASAFWQGISPFGGDDAATGAARAAALAAAVRIGTYLTVPSFPLGAAAAPIPPAEPDWLRAGVAALVGKLGDSGAAPPPAAPAAPAVGGAGVAALALAAYAAAESAAPSGEGRSIFVLAQPSAEAVLGTMDVMAIHDLMGI